MGLIKMNGVNYWGSAYGQGIIAPMIYSLEEREVGVFENGKPLYQRTINGTSHSSGSESINIQILNVDKMVLLDGALYCGNSVTLPLQYQDGINLFTGYFYDDHIELWNSGNITLSKPFAITIQYTKTTDTAGSGTYTPSKALAVHYSTTEQVIGTWIDGKPLYEITFSQTLNNIASGVATNMADISGLNIDEIADISGRVNYYNGADWFNVNLGTYFGAYAYPTGYLKFLQTMTAQTTDRSYKVSITLRYTKTTD